MNRNYTIPIMDNKNNRTQTKSIKFSQFLIYWDNFNEFIKGKL